MSEKEKTTKTSFKFYILAILAVLIVFFFIAGRDFLPKPAELLAGTVTEEGTPTVTPTPTELPESFPDVIPDYFDNQNETDGLLVGAAILVLVILFGVLVSIRNNEK